MKIDFKFQLGQTVTLKEINRPGLIDACALFDVGVQYRVAYWNNGDRKTEWVYEGEIEYRDKYAPTTL
jgi:hypothetical protein